MPRLLRCYTSPFTRTQLGYTFVKGYHLLFAFALTLLIVAFTNISPAEASYNRPHFNQPNNISATLDLISARKQYQKALEALRSGKKKRFHQLQANLQNYPLFSYLSYYEYKRYIKTANNEDVKEYITAHLDSPTGYRLRRTWLKHLAKTKQWQLYIENHTPTNSSAYNCHYQWAQYQTGNKEKALAAAKDLWLIGKSQHKNCDQLFSAWKKTEAYNDEVIWRRMALAMKKGNTQLANYISKSLSQLKDRKKIQRWKAIRSKPKKLTNISYFKTDDSKTREIILYGLHRLLRKNPNLTLTLWPEYQSKFQFTDKEIDRFNLNTAKYLAFKYHDDADTWLHKVDLSFEDYDIHQKRIRLAMYQGRWADVYHWITLLPPEKSTSKQWQYWSAVALEKTAGKLSYEIYFNEDQRPLKPSSLTWNSDPLAVHKNFIDLMNNESSFSLDFHLTTNMQQTKEVYLEKANSIYKAIATDRNYYSFLASERLQIPLDLNELTASYNDTDLEKIETHAGIQRARELYILGRRADARSEWYFAIQDFSEEEKSYAAKLAELWGWHNQAILTASKSSHRDNLDLRFPRAYQDTVAYNARQLGINSAWVFSLIRQESAFMADAKSPAGAMGMMQLLPSTAKQVSRKIGLRYSGANSLLEPRRNIRLGTAYLGELMKKFNGNIVLATAAYNAGPYRVKGWRPTHQVIDGDVWIETIPYNETRNYVQNIMTYQAIYRHQLGQPPKLSNSISYIYPKKTKTSPTVAAISPE